MIVNTEKRFWFINLIAFAAVVMTSAAPVSAAERVWVGALNNAWIVPINWSTGQVPQAADDARLDAGAFRTTINIGSPSQCAILHLLEVPFTLQGSGLTVDGISAVDAGQDITHALNLDMTPNSAGAWFVGQSTTVDLGGSLVGGGNVNKTGDGVLVLNGNNASYMGNVNVTAGELRAGAGDSLGNDTKVNVDANGTLRIVDGELFGGIGGTGAVIIEAGASIGYNDQLAIFSGVVSGTGDLNKGGLGVLTLSGANIYTGGSEVRDGTLLLNNTSGSATGAGDVEVQDAATLGGDGRSSGTTTVLSGGAVAPGSNIGSLTLGDVAFDSGSTLSIEIAGTTPDSQYDQLVVEGEAVLGGTLDISEDEFLTPQGAQFVVLTADTLTGTFDSVEFPITSTFEWTILYDQANGQVVAKVCPDSDDDGNCDSEDVCPGFDDFGIDSDSDGVPDECDGCPGFDDAFDADADGVPDDCDICVGFDDNEDVDSDGIPDGCDDCLVFGTADGDQVDIDFFVDPGFQAGFQQSPLVGAGNEVDWIFGSNFYVQIDIDPNSQTIHLDVQDLAGTGPTTILDGSLVIADFDWIEQGGGLVAGVISSAVISENVDARPYSVSFNDDTITLVQDSVFNLSSGGTVDLTIAYEVEFCDSDGDGVPDSADVCPGFDDNADADGDGIPDGCDACAGFDDTLDVDTDGVPDGCDACPGFDNSTDCNSNGLSDCDELTQQGLHGTYYPSTDFTGTPTFRLDAGIDFDWDTGEPFPGFGVNQFSVRWSGYVRSEAAGTYTFTTHTDDGSRLWVNGQQLIDDWTTHAPQDNSATIDLAAGIEYAITMEYFEGTGGAVAQLRWTPPGDSDAVIPATNLFASLDCDANNVPDECDPDTDGDGVPDGCDNCPDHVNPDQLDCDEDGKGDVCEIANCMDSPLCLDCNNNAIPDGCDEDTLPRRNASFPMEHTVDSNFDGASSVFAADVDGDGDTDILGAAFLADEIAWWENDSVNGDGTTWTKHTVDGNFDGARSVFATDVDGDGDTDILGAARNADDIAWWENNSVNGDGTTWTKHTVDDNFDGASSVFAADVDGDGDTDILGAAQDAGDIAWWENDSVNGDGTTWTKHTVDGNFDGARSVFATDVDGDGDTDILGAAINADDIAWWENDSVNGDGTTWTKHTVDGNFNGAYSVFAADVDGDGDTDILGAAINAHDIAWWENRGGQFGLATTATAPVDWSAGQTDDVFEIVVTHNGRAGDNDVELHSFAILLEESLGVPLTTPGAEAVIDSMSIYLDDGSGDFDAGLDTWVTSVDTLALVDGVQTIDTTPGDPLAQVAFGTPETYFVVVTLQATIDPGAVDAIDMTHVADLSTAVDITSDCPLLQEDPDSDVTASISLIPGDCDGDGDADLDDYANMNACITGPGGGLGAGCECFDFDSDGDIDLRDYAEFQLGFTGN